MTAQLKKMFLTVALLAFAMVTTSSFTQNDKPRESPAATATGKIGTKTITIHYSQPAVKNRDIWGKLVPYGQVWRTGANETTSIEFSDDVSIEGKPLAKGKYALFTIPNEKEWTVIINKTIKWGAFTYKQEDDVVRFTIPVKKNKSFTERMTFDVSNQGVVMLRWANEQVEFKVK